MADILAILLLLIPVFIVGICFLGWIKRVMFTKTKPKFKLIKGGKYNEEGW